MTQIIAFTLQIEMEKYVMQASNFNKPGCNLVREHSFYVFV